MKTYKVVKEGYGATKYRIMWQYKTHGKEIYIQYCDRIFSALKLYYWLKRKPQIKFVKFQKNY